MPGLRQDEVAQQLDISRASVAMYLRRARESRHRHHLDLDALFADELLRGSSRTLRPRLGVDRA